MATADMQFLIDRLDSILQQSRRNFFGGRIQIEEGELQQIVDGMRTAFPQEVTLARRVLQDREHIIKNAQDEAEHIMSTAKQQQDDMLSNHSVVVEARQRSEQMVREAEEERDKVVEGASSFALDTLTEVQEALDALDSAVSSNQSRVRHIIGQLQDQG